LHVKKDIQGCGYEDSGMILLQTYLYAYSILKGIIFELLPLSSYALNQMMLSLLEALLDGLLWNSFKFCHVFFFLLIVFKYLEIEIPLGQTLFFEKVTIHSE
jgi:hypothetical protein